MVLSEIFYYFSSFFLPVVRTCGKALRYYIHNSFEPSGDFDAKLLQHAILEPTCPHVASQHAPKSRLGGLLGRLGGLVGRPGGLLGRLGGLLGRLGGLLSQLGTPSSCLGLLGRFLGRDAPHLARR